jgi:acyl dehydratase
MSGRYFDDFQVGERFRSPGATVTESEIVSYAFAYDPQPFHIDAEAAAESPFGGLIASGMHTLGVGWRMFLQEGLLKACSLGSPGIDELRWTAPVRPGDTIHTEAQVLKTRPSSSRSDRGTLHMGYRMVNQRGETVLTMTIIHILKRAPGNSESGES